MSILTLFSHICIDVWAIIRWDCEHSKGWGRGMKPAFSYAVVGATLGSTGELVKLAVGLDYQQFPVTAGSQLFAALSLRHDHPRPSQPQM